MRMRKDPTSWNWELKMTQTIGRKMSQKINPDCELRVKTNSLIANIKALCQGEVCSWKGLWTPSFVVCKSK
jgi:hypothetical protein